MARRELFYTAQDDGRDNGKVFKIVEMSAFQAESFAYRVGLALAKGGVQLPDELMSRVKDNQFNMADLAVIGLQCLTGLNFGDLKPLLDDIQECIHIIPDKKHGHITRPIIDDDIEEVLTIVKLRKMVMELHLNFSQTADTQTTAT